MKKALLSLALAVALVAMFAAPAFAATTVTLKTEDLGIGDDRLSLYGTVPDGEGDSGEWAPTNRTFTVTELFTIVDTWVIVFKADASDMNLATIVQSDQGWWLGQSDAFFTIDGATVTIDVAGWRADNADIFAGASTAVLGKFTLANWDGPIALSDVESSYVITSVSEGTPPPPPGSSGGDGDKESAKTGDTAMIALAIAALTLAAGATIFIARKIKA
jgi:LPXTG-motif cell wall-anchored protein